MNRPRAQPSRQYSAKQHTHGRGLDSNDFLADLLGSELFRQVAPLIVIFVVPLFVLATNKYRRTLFSPFRYLFYQLTIMLEVLSGVLPWNWYGGSRDKKVPEKKKAIRTRAEQLASTSDAGTEGIVNSSIMQLPR
jgi:ubiquitin carboxyl-terminal hydrolase 1